MQRPDANSAKGHFNPAGNPHGHHAGAEHSAGDLPNLLGDTQGNARQRGEMTMLSLSQGADGIIVGTIALLDIGNGDAALRKMFVARPFRGKAHGVALGLLRTLLDWAMQKGIASIYLGTTAKFLAAHRFYEKNGFAEIAKAELPQSFPVMSVDTRLYRLTLKAASDPPQGRAASSGA